MMAIGQFAGCLIVLSSVTAGNTHSHAGPMRGGTVSWVIFFEFRVYECFGFGDSDPSGTPYRIDKNDRDLEVRFMVVGSIIGGIVLGICRIGNCTSASCIFRQVLLRAGLGGIVGAITLTVFCNANIEPLALPFLGFALGAFIGLCLSLNLLLVVVVAFMAEKRYPWLIKDR